MNDPFFNDFKKEAKGFFKASIPFVVLGIVLNLLFWGAVIWFALWALSHFGVI